MDGGSIFDIVAVENSGAHDGRSNKGWQKVQITLTRCPHSGLRHVDSIWRVVGDAFHRKSARQPELQVAVSAWMDLAGHDLLCALLFDTTSMQVYILMPGGAERPRQVGIISIDSVSMAWLLACLGAASCRHITFPPSTVSIHSV